MSLMREDVFKLVFWSSCFIVVLVVADWVWFRGSGTKRAWRLLISGIRRIGGSQFCEFVFSFITSLLDRIGFLREKTPVTLYVRKRPDTELGGADRQLWDKVTKEMSRKHSLDLRILEADERLRDLSGITFILCPVTSRVGSNVEHALRGIVSQKNMVLLLFHPVAPHVSFHLNTKEVLFEPKHQALGDIVDVVMWSTGAGAPKIYDCAQNSQAISQICNFIYFHSSITKR